MRFIDKTIFVPYYLKDIVNPIIKKHNGHYYMAGDLYNAISRVMSDRDQRGLYLLQNFMTRLICFGRYSPDNISNRIAYSRYYDAGSVADNIYDMVVIETDNMRLNHAMSDIMAPNKESKVLLETLLTFDDKHHNTYSYKDLLDVKTINYPGRPAHITSHIQGTEEANIRKIVSTERVGLIVTINAGFGNILLESDETERNTFVDGIPEYLYRYIKDHIGVEEANYSYLSLARLKNFTTLEL